MLHCIARMSQFYSRRYRHFYRPRPPPSPVLFDTDTMRRILDGPPTGYRLSDELMEVLGTPEGKRRRRRERRELHRRLMERFEQEGFLVLPLDSDEEQQQQQVPEQENVPQNTKIKEKPIWRRVVAWTLRLRTTVSHILTGKAGKYSLNNNNN